MGVAFVCCAKTPVKLKSFLTVRMEPKFTLEMPLKLRNSSINNFVLDLRCLKLNVQFPDVSQKALSSRVHTPPQDIPLVCRGTQLL